MEGTSMFNIHGNEIATIDLSTGQMCLVFDKDTFKTDDTFQYTSSTVVL